MVLLVGCRLSCVPMVASDQRSSGKSGKAERIIRLIRGRYKIRVIRLIRCALPPFLYRLIVVAALTATVVITAATGIATLVARI
jgi:hypothetical protein